MSGQERLYVVNVRLRKTICGKCQAKKDQERLYVVNVRLRKTICGKCQAKKDYMW